MPGVKIMWETERDRERKREYLFNYSDTERKREYPFNYSHFTTYFQMVATIPRKSNIFHNDPLKTTN